MEVLMDLLAVACLSDLSVERWFLDLLQTYLF